MIKNNNILNLQKTLCELKLEERRLNTDMARLVVAKKMIDFAKAKQVTLAKRGVKSKIERIENLINPNTIA